MTKQSTKQPAVYMMASKKGGTIYTGVTSNLARRVYEHKQEIMGGFTARYECKLLVYYEVHDAMEAAILREKQFKGGSRQKKLDVIQSFNPDWKDLYETII